MMNNKSPVSKWWIFDIYDVIIPVGSQNKKVKSLHYYSTLNNALRLIVGQKLDNLNMENFGCVLHF